MRCTAPSFRNAERPRSEGPRGIFPRGRKFLAVALLIFASPAWAQESPERESEEGRRLFDANCVACHTNGGGDFIGPDLAGVLDRRSRDWLLRFIVEPDRVLAEGDAVALELLEQFNGMPMPNVGLTRDDAAEVLAYLAGPAAAAAGAPSGARDLQPAPRMLAAQSAILSIFLAITIVIVAVFVFVGLSTREPAGVDVAKAYQLRRVLFVIALVLLTSLAVITLRRTPYAPEDATVDRVVYVAARQYDFVFSDEPIATAEDVSQRPRIASLELAAGELVEFRVTSLDVTHGFGIYGPERQLLVQTQAMPGYVNRLVVRLDRPGRYLALCMEYCAGGHHLMEAPFAVGEPKPVASHDRQGHSPRSRSTGAE